MPGARGLKEREYGNSVLRGRIHCNVNLHMVHACIVEDHDEDAITAMPERRAPHAH